MILKFNVDRQTISRTDNNTPHSGSKGYLSAEFTFSEDWEGLVKTAVFTHGEQSYEILLDNNACLVPHEVIECGVLYVAVRGDDTNGNVVYVPTGRERVYIQPAGVVEGGNPAPPTLDVYSEILGTMQQQFVDSQAAQMAQEGAETARTGAEAARDKAEEWANISQAKTLKVTELERELSEYKKTLSLININQEAKQTAEDIIIHLPKNAANGQAQAKLLGQTYIFNQLVNNGNFSSGFDGWTLFYAAGISTIENGFTANYTGSNRDFGVRQELLDISINDKLYIALDGLHISGKNSGVVFWDSNSFNNLKQSGITITETSWQSYSTIHTSTKINPRFGVYSAYTTETAFSVKNVRIINLTKMFGAGNEPELGAFESMYPENYYPYSTGEYISVNGAFRLTSTDGTQVSQVYFPSYTLRSAGEVHDELTQDSFIRRVSDAGEVLAQPIVTPIQTSGTLLSYPDGTVTSEGAVADAGVYGYNGIYVINHDLPIKSLEKIVKIDYETGIETEIPVGNAIISPDKTSFTHPNLSKGDIVFFTYFHDVESIPPIINIEYYDSRYTIKDTTNDKFYQWNITSAGGVPSITLTEV